MSPKDSRGTGTRSLTKLAERVLTGDDFEVLDILMPASDSEVLAAYKRVLQETPDAAQFADDPALVHRAASLRARIDAAFENLKDEDRRRAYSLLRQEEEQDRDAQLSAERALEGERWFRKGQGLLQRKYYGDAVEAFGMASHLDPRQGEYGSHLGYSLYLSNPADLVVQREAMEHIASGIKSAPGSGISHVFLGRIFKAKGDVAAASKLFQRALRIKPDCYPATQELRLLALRERKGKGLFSRLRERFS